MVVSKLVDGFFLVGGIRKRCLIYQEEEVLPLNDPFPTVSIPLFSSLQRTRLDSIKLTNVRIHNLVERNPRSVGVHSSRAFLTEGSSSIVSSNRLIVASAVHQVQTLLSLSLFLSSYRSTFGWTASKKGKIKITLWKRNKAEKRLFLFIFVYRYYALETLSFFPFLRERMKDVSRGIRIKEEEKEREREYVWNNLTGGVTHLKKHEKRKCYGRGSKRRTERLNNLIKYEY